MANHNIRWRLRHKGGLEDQSSGAVGSWGYAKQAYICPGAVGGLTGKSPAALAPLADLLSGKRPLPPLLRWRLSHKGGLEDQSSGAVGSWGYAKLIFALELLEA